MHSYFIKLYENNHNSFQEPLAAFNSPKNQAVLLPANIGKQIQWHYGGIGFCETIRRLLTIYFSRGEAFLYRRHYQVCLIHRAVILLTKQIQYLCFKSVHIRIQICSKLHLNRINDKFTKMSSQETELDNSSAQETSPSAKVKPFSNRWMAKVYEEKPPFPEEVLNTVFAPERISTIVKALKEATTKEVQESNRLLEDDFTYSLQITSFKIPHVNVHLSRM